MTALPRVLGNGSKQVSFKSQRDGTVLASTEAGSGYRRPECKREPRCELMQSVGRVFAHKHRGTRCRSLRPPRYSEHLSPHWSSRQIRRQSRPIAKLSRLRVVGVGKIVIHRRGVAQREAASGVQSTMTAGCRSQESPTKTQGPSSFIVKTWGLPGQIAGLSAISP